MVKLCVLRNVAGLLALSAVLAPAGGVNVEMADGNAAAETAALYYYLRQIEQSENVLYGHQNEYTSKVATWLGGASDTYDMVRDNAAVFGVDALALTGAELGPFGQDKAASARRFEKLMDISRKAAANGSIISLSCHMPNFAKVFAKGKNSAYAYGYDFSGYTPNDLSGDVARRITPEGDLHAVYTAYLDMVADYIAALEKEHISVLFRPFHECDGGWFWWGSASCPPSVLKILFRSTVEYMRDVRGLHNIIYAYGPSTTFTSTADYALYYPGDEYVDIIGFDMYHVLPKEGDGWMADLSQKLAVLEDFAASHGKVAALTELGISGNAGGAGGILPEGNPRKKWFTEVLDVLSSHKVAYFLTWANFSMEQCYEPYIKADGTEHEMAVDFRSFFNDRRSVFASQIGDYRLQDGDASSPFARQLSGTAVTATHSEAVSGYIVAPLEDDRLLDAFTFKARVYGKAKKLRFRLYDASETLLAELKAGVKDGNASATLPGKKLASFGKRKGRVELVDCSGKNPVVLDSVTVLYNVPFIKRVPDMGAML